MLALDLIELRMDKKMKESRNIQIYVLLKKVVPGRLSLTESRASSGVVHVGGGSHFSARLPEPDRALAAERVSNEAVH